MFATRCRFIIFQGDPPTLFRKVWKDVNIQSLWYKDLTCTCSPEGVFDITTKDGDKLHWKATVRGADLFDFALVLGSNDTYSKFTSVDRVQTKRQNKATAYEVLQYFAEAVDAVR
jgi:hypothetical protein